MAPTANASSLNPRHALRDAIIAVMAVILGAAVICFANIPTRVSVVESRVNTLEKNMDAKLDTIIARIK